MIISREVQSSWWATERCYGRDHITLWRLALARVAQAVGASSRKPNGGGFDFRSGHIPRLRVQSPVGECTRRNQLIFLLTLMGFLCFFNLFLSLPSSLSKGNKKKCPRLGIKNYFKTLQGLAGKALRSRKREMGG